jgi:hypothetical protein
MADMMLNCATGMGPNDLLLHVTQSLSNSQFTDGSKFFLFLLHHRWVEDAHHVSFGRWLQVIIVVLQPDCPPEALNIAQSLTGCNR